MRPDYLSQPERTFLVGSRGPGSADPNPAVELGMSYGQRAMFFLHQSAPSSAAYNVAFPVRIRTTVDHTRLKNALMRLVARHPLLRANFTMVNGYPRQIISETRSVCLRVHESSGAQEELGIAVAQAYRQPFDIEHGPVFRIDLFSWAPNAHVLLLCAHHIACDAWSLWLLLEELRGFYAGEVVPPPGRHYADFVNWERDTLAGPRGAVLQHYWKGRLAGELLPLQLPTDYPRKSRRAQVGASIRFQIDAALTQGLRALSRSAQTTLYTTLLAAFLVLLHRICNEDDIVLGSPVHGRITSAFERTVGNFVNVVVMRENLSDNPPFRDLLGRVRKRTLEAFANAEYPFSRLVEDLCPSREPGRSPIFDVMFVYQQPRPSGVAVDAWMTGSSSAVGEEMEPFYIDQQECQFDLTLEITEGKRSLYGTLKYDVGLFAQQTSEQMAARYERLLREVVADPEAPIDAIPILDEVERRLLLKEWNPPPPEPESCICLHQLFEKQAASSPLATAVIVGNESLSYAALDDRANCLANELLRLGIRIGDRVGIWMERCIEMVVAILGALKAGGAYVPLDPAYPDERVRFVLKDADIRVVLTRTKVEGARFVDSHAVIGVQDVDPDGTSVCPAVASTSRDLAYILYTSGSTGQPKGVAIEHHNVVALMEWAHHTFGGDELKCVLASTSLSFDLSVFEIFAPLTSGGTIVLIPNLLSLANIEVGPVSLLSGTPSILAEVVAGRYIPPAVRVVTVAGETLTSDLVQRLYATGSVERVYNLYGPTECTTYSTCALIRPDARLVTIGRPITGTQVYILDRYMRPVPIGVRGELVVAGRGVARGYVNSPGLTSERFVPVPFGRTDAVCYKTGDYGRFLGSGEIEFLGRCDTQVKLRGFRIELGEIESVLREHESIREAAAIVAEHDDGRRRLVAYVALKANEVLEIEVLRDFLCRRLPYYMVPTIIFPLDRLPRTQGGKINRAALEPLGTEGSKRAPVRPRSQTEQTLLEIWRTVLGRDDIGVYDNFFEVGGDSIMSLQIVARANARGLRLTSEHFLTQGTIASLAEVADDVPVVDVEQGRVVGEVPLGPMQRWFFEQQLTESNHFNQSIMLKLPTGVDRAHLSRALDVLVDHHDALRARYTHTDSGWTQHFAEAFDSVPCEMVDLRGLEEQRQDERMWELSQKVQGNLNLEIGPLLLAVLFELGADRGSRLLLVVHHLVVDVVSWQILLQDLATAYAQADSPDSISLPPKTTSYRRWNEGLWSGEVRERVRGELGYWLGQSGMEDLPTDLSSADHDCPVSSAMSVHLMLDVHSTDQLVHTAHQAYNTQVLDLLLTALARTILVWTQRGHFTLDLERHGREALTADCDVSRTVGWFTALFPLCLRCDASAELGSSISAIKEQLRSVPNGGIGYGLLRYGVPHSSEAKALVGQPKRRLVFNYLGQIGLSASSLLSDHFKAADHMRSLRGRLLYTVEVTNWVSEGVLHTSWTTSSEAYLHSTIERRAQDYLLELRAILEHCQEPAAGRYTPSDFPEAELTPQELEALVERLSGKRGY